MRTESAAADLRNLLVFASIMLVTVNASIRPYQPSDAAATLEVYQQAIHQTAARFYNQEQIDAWAPATIEIDTWGARRELAWTVVAELNDRVIGFADLTKEGVFDMLFVHPDVGGQGVGRAFVTAVISRGKDIGLRRIITHASHAARPVFERLGFVVDTENRNNFIRGVRVPNYDMHIDL